MTTDATPYLGLAPFLRMSIAGINLLPLAQEMLSTAETHPDDANLWMNLSTIMLCLQQREIGLAIQSQALEINRIYHIAAAVQPVTARLLMIVAPGDLAENTPLDCLLENSAIELILYYISVSDPLLSAPLPEHDALMVGIIESDENRTLLSALAQLLANWPKPIINAPQHIPNTGRDTASTLLMDASGLLIPQTFRVARTTLLAIAAGQTSLATLFSNCDFPIILRPVGSQAGRDLAKIINSHDIQDYLEHVNAKQFFLARFIDYCDKDGLFRKYRIALIDGVAFVCHIAIASHWMIHYVNADMYQDAHKRAAEATLMANFDDFVSRHHAALRAIHQRTKLDYLCVDCAETQHGQLLIFEIDHAMVVHAMDPADLFPYKQFYMNKIKDAWQNYMLRLI